MGITPKQRKLFYAGLKHTGAGKDDILARVNVASTKDLTGAKFEEILRHFESLGFHTKGGPRKPATSKQRLMSKITAIRAELNLPEAYVDAMCQRMFKNKDGRPVSSHRWLNADQLHRLVAALSYHQRRKRTL